MIDEVKELIGLIKELPDIALWILAGFAIYKTFIFSSVTGSLYYGFKFAVTKLSAAYDAKLNRKPPPKEVNLSHIAITHDGTYDVLLSTLADLRGVRTKDSTYLHSRDVSWLREAIKEKREREASA